MRSDHFRFYAGYIYFRPIAQWNAEVYPVTSTSDLPEVPLDDVQRLADTFSIATRSEVPL